MAIETKQLDIDGTKFTLTTLAAPLGRKVALRLFKPIGATLKVDMTADNVDLDLAKGLEALSDEDIDFVTASFAREASVELLDEKAGTSRWLKLPLVADDLFAGPKGHRLWLRFMAQSIELNFGDFSEVLGAALRK